MIGSANADLVVRVPRRPLDGETLVGSDVAHHAGGKGANQAVAAALAGANVTFCACVGDDANAELVRSSLNAGGVRRLAIETVDRPTGTAIVLVTPDGENSIVLSPGANRNFSPTIAARLEEHWGGAGVVVVNLEIPSETVRYVSERVESRGSRLVLNAAPAAAVSPSVLRRCDPLIVNEVEACAVLDEGVQSGEDADFEPAAKRLVEAGARSVVITLGQRGAMLADSAGTMAISAYSVATVDTTGAGDAFVGATAARLAAGADLRDAIQYACAVSALAVQSPGAQSSYADRNRVEMFMQCHRVSPDADND